MADARFGAMALAKSMKVFRTPIGFHDAYVAAPSQKAALEAWGTTSNLFARGEADIVTDAALSEEPLKQPGVVIKRLRGTAEQHLAALPREKSSKAPSKPPSAPKPRLKPKPRPSRTPLDRLERQLADLETSQSNEKNELDRRIAALRKEAQALAQRHDKARAVLTRKVERAREQYEKALRDWD